MNVRLLTLLICLVGFSAAIAQQVPDTLFQPAIQKPAYALNKGPVVLVDEAHHNFHTTTNRFKPFSILLRRDGYQVNGGTSTFSKETLKKVGILVISNALNERNAQDWSLPTPSAFTDEEIQAVEAWVKAGGSLLLIADHMPFPGCNEKLAAAFGFKFYNGFALDTTKQGSPDLFSVTNKRLSTNKITSDLDSIYSFTGQAFDIPASATALLTLDENFKIWSPRVAWRFEQETTKMPGNKKVQIAMLEYGKGRVVVSGEAAMFTAQLAGGVNKMGFNHPIAKHNSEFLLRLIHWLDHR
ncbi:MAG TPA: DUF4350 domain-containing protein [Cyclobacteriaceae bacterium]|nr:DUF4350 domain-containing protein [Cyclobacteriaceae bacterium]